jgi:hypothetical protein
MWTMIKGENNWNCVYLTDKKNKTRIQGGWVGESKGFGGAPAGADGSIYAIVPKQYAISTGFMKAPAVSEVGGSCWTIAPVP